MRLVSFNIQNRRGESRSAQRDRMRAQADFLRSLRPDVVALQEVTPDAWQVLASELDTAEGEYLPREDGESKGEAVPVFTLGQRLKITSRSSFWLSDTPDRPSRLRGAVHPRVCSALKLSDGISDWWVFNIHLDHRNARVRRRSLDLLRTKVSELSGLQDHRLLCGDFNMPGYRKVVRSFCDSEPGWEDATRFHPLGALRPTYLGWGPFHLARARIDLCLHSRGVRVGEYHAVNPEWRGETLSDHRALVVDVEKKEK